MVVCVTAYASKVESEWELYTRSPLITQSNPPGGTGHTVFSSGIPV